MSRTGQPAARIPRRRTTFTVEQLYLLEMYFAQSQYVGCEERERLARILSLDEYQVKIWFQNRRIRMRRDANK
ncbi:Protein CBR-CEH-7 [Caenorhabditis briggsae]|uniref:Protein CBR-CEH-7 n=2 Tax=Caenorhabditis TaxID=6237 RepID=A8XCG4_CAEBR|nr:Protein CBR-CEH-7 [Caenorhabditis briggsae]PIC44652.1 hypothetical protein B9Z55_004950 [Caenorhabditis nigoni]CAP30331.2 Protein CBR-CEH-7 [Caenorhabditis briggsae]